MHLVSCGLWELHCALIQGGQDRSSLCAPSCCRFGVLSLRLQTFQHGGSVRWEIVQIDPTKKAIALWKLPALSHNHSTWIEASLEIFFLHLFFMHLFSFLYFSFMSLPTCDIVCGADLMISVPSSIWRFLNKTEQPLFAYIVVLTLPLLWK